MALATAGLTIIVVKTIQDALIIVEKLQYGEVPLDAQAISGLLSESTRGSGGLVLDIATYGIVLCWLIGIFDSYRIGKSQEALNDRERTARQVVP